MELQNQRVCDGANVGCAFLPVTNCSSQNPNKTIQGFPDPLLLEMVTRKMEPAPSYAGYSFGWLIRKRKFFRDEIRKVIEETQIPMVISIRHSLIIVSTLLILTLIDVITSQLCSKQH